HVGAGGAGCCPTVGAVTVSPAGVSTSRFSPPHDHFTAGPDCRVIVSGRGHVGGAGGCPGIIDASARLLRYRGKRIVSSRRRHFLQQLVFRSGSPRLQRLLAPFNCSELQAVAGLSKYRRRVVTLIIFLQGAQYSG